MLEGFVAARADNALEALACLLPDRVTVRKHGADAIVPRESVAVGDVVLVRPGKRIAVDGTVLSGTASVNQAAITGESVPAEKQARDAVFAVTLVESGAVEIGTTNA